MAVWSGVVLVGLLLLPFLFQLQLQICYHHLRIDASCCALMEASAGQRFVTKLDSSTICGVGREVNMVSWQLCVFWSSAISVPCVELCWLPGGERKNMCRGRWFVSIVCYHEKGDHLFCRSMFWYLLLCAWSVSSKRKSWSMLKHMCCGIWHTLRVFSLIVGFDNMEAWSDAMGSAPPAKIARIQAAGSQDEQMRKLMVLLLSLASRLRLRSVSSHASCSGQCACPLTVDQLLRPRGPKKRIWPRRLVCQGMVRVLLMLTVLWH